MGKTDSEEREDGEGRGAAPPKLPHQASGEQSEASQQASCIHTCSRGHARSPPVLPLSSTLHTLASLILTTAQVLPLSYRRETWGTETSRHQPWGTTGSQQKQDLVQATKVQSPCFYHHTSCPTGIAQPSGWGRGRSVHHGIPCVEHCDLHLIGPRQTPVEGMRNEGMNL